MTEEFTPIVEKNEQGGTIIHRGTDTHCRWCNFPFMAEGWTPLERSMHSGSCNTRWRNRTLGRTVYPDKNLDQIKKTDSTKGPKSAIKTVTNPETKKVTSLPQPSKTASVKGGFDLDRIRAVRNAFASNK